MNFGVWFCGWFFFSFKFRGKYLFSKFWRSSIKRKLWRTPLYPTFCPWTVALIIPSIVTIYKIEGNSPHAPLPWSTARSPSLLGVSLSPSSGGRSCRPQGSHLEIVCVMEVVVLPSPPLLQQKAVTTDYVLNFLPWGRREPTFIPDQMAKVLFNFCLSRAGIWGADLWSTVMW